MTMKTNTNTKKRVAWLATAALLAACAAPPYSAYAIENDAEEVSNVVVTDGSLQDVVRVGRARVERVPGGELRVVVPVRNIDGERIQILAQIGFVDAQGLSVGDDSNQQVVIIGPGSTRTLDWVSHSELAADWVLRLSWNK
jgi:uncharacterized lipoprotein YajG